MRRGNKLARRERMARYLVRFSYTREGLQGLVKEGGTSRRDSLARTVEAVGGTLDAFYYAFGEHDLYAIVDVPDHEAMTAVALTIGASGSASVNTIVLVTPEEVDSAVNRSVAYRPPGQDAG